MNSNVKAMMTNTNGKFFVVVFKKANGDMRRMLARVGVKKGLTGTGRSKPLADHLVCVWDVANKGYRTVNVDSVVGFKCGKESIGSVV